MSVRKQFQPIEVATLASPVDSQTDAFVPELSMNVKDILAQFAYVDNVRLKDLMKHGYESQDDDSAFDMPDFDSLDIAEKEELYNQSVEFINKFEAEQRKKDQEQHDDVGDAALAKAQRAINTKKEV